jgi:hypothetical protein
MWLIFTSRAFLVLAVPFMVTIPQASSSGGGGGGDGGGGGSSSSSSSSSTTARFLTI